MRSSLRLDPRLTSDAIRLGDGCRSRGSRPAQDEKQGILRLLDRFRSGAKLEYVPDLSRASRIVAGSEREGGGARCPRGGRPRIHHPSRLDLREEELFLSRPSEGLPDLAVRPAARDGRLSRDSLRWRREED